MTAVNFLTNPAVQRSTINQKQRFLRDKGLSEREIQIACERAGVFTGVHHQQRIEQPQPPQPQVQHYHHHPQQQQHQHQQLQENVWKKPLSVLERVKEILSSVAVFGGVVYLVYKFYKKFIEPWIFGGARKDEKTKSVGDKVDELTVKVDMDMKQISQEVTRIREDVYHMSQFDIRREMQNFKSDLDAIKGLLLNKKQFASPSLSVVPPSIPSWQLKARHDSDNDKNDDAGSGSGSSETEVVTKNSDSSIEIM